MGEFSIWHWLVVIVIVLLLFGRGKVSDLMGDVAQGIKTFKKGLAEDDKPAPSQSDGTKAVEHPVKSEPSPSEAARPTESTHS